MERSAIREHHAKLAPDFASLHPGYHRHHAFTAATSSNPRLRGSTPQAHTTAIWMTTRAIISQTTPGSWYDAIRLPTIKGETTVAPRPSVLQMPLARRRISVGNSSGV